MNIVNGDVKAFSHILLNVVRWMSNEGEPLWTEEQVLESELMKSNGGSDIYVGYEDDVPVVGAFVQDVDPIFWPNIPKGHSYFIHKLAVHRDYKGLGYSARFIDWVRAKAEKDGISHIRLDCDATRCKLCALYERYGFSLADRRFVGPYDSAFFEVESNRGGEQIGAG